MSSDQGILYQQVAGKLAALIEAGVLPPGGRIPSVRRAMEQHGVSLSTVVQAYLLLENQGLIEARPRSGYFVRAVLRTKPEEPQSSRPARAVTVVGVGALQARLFEQARHPDIVPMGAASPGPDLFPGGKLSRIMASVSRRMGGRGLSYDMPPGSEALRRQIARRSLDWGLWWRWNPPRIFACCRRLRNWD
jgi:DNA-binding transcriptional MocR family regulator